MGLQNFEPYTFTDKLLKNRYIHFVLYIFFSVVSFFISATSLFYYYVILYMDWFVSTRLHYYPLLH